MEQYKTILGENIYKETINKSRFIAYIKHVESEQQALDYLNSIRKLHSDARHNCYAFRIQENNIGRFSDDGEPCSTAGLPIFEVLSKNEITNAIIVVTRYFGGVLLGTGGLVRAYGGTAKKALDGANTVTMQQSDKYSLLIDYKYYDSIVSYVDKQDDVKILATNYTDKISLELLFLPSALEKFVKKVTDLTGNNYSFDFVESDYLPW